MKNFRVMLISGILLLLALSVAQAGEGETVDSYSIWIGGHYTEFSDYTKKVGEYNLGNNEGLPEFGLGYFSKSPTGLLRFKGFYYDDKNVFGQLRATLADRFKIKAQYRSLIKQDQQDLLENIEGREYFPTTDTYGGKTLTHDLQDVGADYNTHRQEILAELAVKLREKNNIRFVATHRTILKTGSEQSIASNHCFSCHLTSQSAEVDTKQHQFETGIDAESGNFDFGYRFGYRVFESDVSAPQVYYDEARHPVNGGAVSEFGSRQIYDDTTMAYNVLPKTEKVSHKVRMKGKVGKGRVAGAVGYSKATNEATDLSVKSWNGALNYATVVNPSTRVVAKGSMVKLTADDPFIDIPTYRDGAADGNEMDFDYTRYSAYDRTEVKLSAEMIKRMNPKTTLSILGGVDVTNRDDYPVMDDGTSTKKFYGQAKVNYRKGLRYKTTVKYRFEAISDPFISGKGLFEEPAYGSLYPIAGNFVFYWEREDLRYQDITTLPTQAHIFSWQSTYIPSSKYSVNVGVNGKYDKNADLDSLDVKHFMLVPSLNLNVTPNEKFMFSTGYTYNYYKSRGPVTIALFDG